MRWILAAAVGLALVGCVSAPSDLRKHEPHAAGDSTMNVADGAHCLAGAVAEIWDGFASGNASVASSGETAEVQIHTNYLVGIVDVRKRASGSRMTAWLQEGWNFPVTDGRAAARQMIEMCGGHADPPA